MRSFMLLLSISLINCGHDGDSCTVEDNGDGTKTLTCGETVVTIKDGETGPDTLQELIETALHLRDSYASSIFDIWCYIDDELTKLGTGTKTHDGRVITAHHVAESCHYFKFFNEVYRAGHGGEWQQLNNRDVAIIDFIQWNVVGDEASGVTPKFNLVPTLGEHLFALHYPGIDLRKDLQISQGKVVDDQVKYSLEFYNLYWQDSFTSDYAATGGSSGAPVFNRAGEWFAIHVGGYSGTNLDLNYTLPLQE